LEKHIVSFSGGKDSTAMLLKMIENNMKIDEVIFCDTGKEFEDMYKHIEKVQSMIDIPITVLKSEKSFEYWMFEHVKIKGKNKGQKGYSWPDFRNRWCTQVLKKQIIRRYLKKYKDYKIIEYHGIAIDESHRSEKNKEKNCRYPLIEWNMTEKDCLEYCYSKGLDWNGLYKNVGRVSCWCCPLKNLKELEVIYNNYPEYWEKLKNWDNNTYRQFRSDYSIDDLEKKFKK
jgi:3'-phosphoadenosine 5'-phosphosulfate sulfotransferase (PAPS reductase)/FAD synthetase